MIEFINQMPLGGLMLVTALGFLLGRLSFRQLSLGPAGGTLFAALVLGYWGVSLDAFYGEGERHLTVGTFGFVLFIYSVGFEAGPRFFSSIRTQNGWKFISMAIVVNALAVGVSVLWARIFSLDAATTAGMLSGALTSAPTYAAASQFGLDNTRLSVAFAITYPIGLIGLVLIIQLLPGMLRQDLSADSAGLDDEDSARAGRVEVTRAYRVKQAGVVSRKLRDLPLTRECGVVLTLVVLDKAFYGKSLAELNLTGRFHCIIAAIERGSQNIDPTADVILLRHDIISVTGARENIRLLAPEIGDFEQSANETNIAIYTGGIFLGLLVGRINLAPLGIDFMLGPAVGLLFAGLFLGRIGRIGRHATHIPKPARQLVRDLGILLFIGETGIAAGGNLMDGLSVAPWQTLVGAFLVTMTAVLGTLAIGLYVLRLKALDSWGSLCGGLTSSAALHALRTKADSNDVTISYAAAYAVGSVVATLAGQFIAQCLQ